MIQETSTWIVESLDVTELISYVLIRDHRRITAHHEFIFELISKRNSRHSNRYLFFCSNIHSKISQNIKSNQLCSGNGRLHVGDRDGLWASGYRGKFCDCYNHTSSEFTRKQWEFGITFNRIIRIIIIIYGDNSISNNNRKFCSYSMNETPKMMSANANNKLRRHYHNYSPSTYSQPLLIWMVFIWSVRTGCYSWCGCMNRGDFMQRRNWKMCHVSIPLQDNVMLSHAGGRLLLETLLCSSQCFSSLLEGRLLYKPC